MQQHQQDHPLTQSIKPLGGYIELQLPEKEEYYPSLLKVNTGTNAFEYILKVHGYKHVYLPYFTCEAMLKPVKDLGLQYTFYHIDRKLDPVINFEIHPEDCFVYTNYFGIKQKTVSRLANQLKNLIVDNSQAFFSHPIPRIDTFYSCRKFFGVPDGSYLQLNSSWRLDLELDISFDRFSHLIKSIDLGTEAGYGDYVEHSTTLLSEPLKEMSALSKKILQTIDYEYCRERRHANFSFLHEFLKDTNDLPIEFFQGDAPQLYPLLLHKDGLKAQLIQKKIFVPTFWPNVFKWTDNSMYENTLSRNLIALPIDHRYDLDDMERILTVINQLL